MHSARSKYCREVKPPISSGRATIVRQHIILNRRSVGIFPRATYVSFFSAIWSQCPTLMSSRHLNSPIPAGSSLTYLQPYRFKIVRLCNVASVRGSDCQPGMSSSSSCPPCLPSRSSMRRFSRRPILSGRDVFISMSSLMISSSREDRSPISDTRRLSQYAGCFVCFLIHTVGKRAQRRSERYVQGLEFGPILLHLPTYATRDSLKSLTPPPSSFLRACRESLEIDAIRQVQARKVDKAGTKLRRCKGGGTWGQTSVVARTHSCHQS